MKNKILNFIKKHPKQVSFFVFLLIMTPMISYGFLDSVGAYVKGWGLGLLEMLTSTIKTLMSKVMYAAGFIFDNLLLISISPNLYNEPWVKLAWATIRDVANIAFIFGIILIGFFMIVGNAQWKKMLINLIVVVFIMNFSMFIGRVIIDAGNFTTAIFYSMSSVNVKQDSDKTSHFVVANAILGVEKTYFDPRSIATGLAAFIDPTKLYDKDVFDQMIRDMAAEENITKKKEVDNYVLKTKIMLDIVYIFVAIIFSKALVQAAFMFISRTIYLIKWIILAPVYFAWYFLPGGNGKLYEWFGKITQKAFCATGYMIGIWVLLMFLSGIPADMLEKMGQGMIALIASTAIKGVIVYYSMQTLTKFGTDSCEDGKALGGGIAEKFGSVAKFVGGGAVLKGASMMGGKITRGSIYKARQAAIKSVGEGEWLKKEGWRGNVASWSMKKIENTDKWKIGDKTLEEDMKYQNEEEAAADRRVKHYQGESGLNERRVNRLGVDRGKVKFSFNEKEKKEASKELRLMKDMEKSLIETARLAGADSSQIKKIKEEEKKKRRSYIEKETEEKKDKYILNNYNKSGVQAAISPSGFVSGFKDNGVKGAVKGGGKSIMDFLSGTEAAVINENKEVQKLNSDLKAEEMGIDKDLKESRKKNALNEKERSEKLFDQKQELIIAEKEEVKNIDDLADKIKVIYTELGKNVVGWSPDRLINEMHNDEKFQKIIGDNFKDDADKYIDKVTKKNLLVEEREIHGQQDQSNMGARINKYDLLINRRKEEVRKISDSINVLERKSGILDEDGNPTEESRRAQKELIEQQKDLNQHKGKLSKLEINKNKKLTSSKELDKKIEKEKKDMKRNIEELEKEIKSMDGTIHSMVEKAKNILSEDVKEINQKAQEDLNDYQEKRSKNREILHEHMKEAKKAAAQGEYYSSGRGKHNT